MISVATAKHHSGSVNQDDERVPLLQPSSTTDLGVYPIRWWLLTLVSCISFAQGCIWNNWGPISNSVQSAFGWSDGVVALMANWGPICYLIAVIPSSWIMDIRGARSACVIAAALVFAGALVRCFSKSASVATGLIHLGQIFNGLAGPVAMSIPPVLSATWFPPGQRTTATAIMSMSNYIGVALAFVLGPQLMPAHEASPTSTDLDEIKSSILKYMWMQAGFTGLVFICTVIHFPNKPPNAPSRSAKSERMSFVLGIKSLMRHRQFWLVAAAYGAITGIYSGWSAYLEPNLQEFLDDDAAQTESGWIGFYGTIASCVSGIALGLVSDRLGGKMKAILLLICAVSLAMFLWFALACQGVVLKATSVLYTSSIAGGFFLNGAIPLFYELGVETTYPIAEGITTGVLTSLNNVAGLIFLAIPEIPNLGNIWANWALVAACGFSFLCMVFFQEHYRRTSVDLEHAPIESADTKRNL
eukprot:m.120030 g.120030  ORF g.120030 m.120030 type:complete len:472 (-) comp52074_c0_seq2:819-2234(-)